MTNNHQDTFDEWRDEDEEEDEDDEIRTVSGPRSVGDDEEDEQDDYPDEYPDDWRAIADENIDYAIRVLYEQLEPRGSRWSPNVENEIKEQMVNSGYLDRFPTLEVAIWAFAEWHRHGWARVHTLDRDKFDWDKVKEMGKGERMGDKDRRGVSVDELG